MPLHLKEYFMKKLKILLCLIMIAVLMFAFASQTFAAWQSYRRSAYSASALMIDANCNFGVAKKDWSNAITVVNNGSVPIFLYKGRPGWNVYVTTINPGREYTYRPYNTASQRIQIYAKNSSCNMQNIVVKTTRGSITTY